jgi:hypothetical protein
MKFTSQAKVTGMKRSKGTMESGQSFDSTKVYIETDLDDSKGNAVGVATVEYGFGLSDEFEKYKHLPYPCVCELGFEIVTSGKVQKTQLISIKPLQAAPKPKEAV